MKETPNQRSDTPDEFVDGDLINSGNVININRQEAKNSLVKQKNEHGNLNYPTQKKMSDPNLKVRFGSDNSNN